MSSFDPRSFRLRYFLATVFAAAMMAAALRHVLHVYGGISREEIRLDALLGILVVGLAVIFFRRSWR